MPRLDARRIRAISLDLDDTLWPVGPVIERAEQRLQTWLGTRAPATAALCRDAAQRQRARQQALRLNAAHAHDLGLIRREAIRVLLLQAGEPPELTEPAFDVFTTARHEVQLYDDALPALARLGARFPLVVLSNGNADVHRLGLGGHFRAALGAAQLGFGKPDPRSFAAAAQAAGVAPHQLLHVGDDAALDAAGARASGAQAAWVNRGGAAWPGEPGAAPHASVADLLALCDLLDA